MHLYLNFGDSSFLSPIKILRQSLNLQRRRHTAGGISRRSRCRASQTRPRWDRRTAWHRGRRWGPAPGAPPLWACSGRKSPNGASTPLLWSSSSRNSPWKPWTSSPCAEARCPRLLTFSLCREPWCSREQRIGLERRGRVKHVLSTWWNGLALPPFLCLLATSFCYCFHSSSSSSLLMAFSCMLRL